MSKSEFSYGVEGCQISYHQKEFKFPKIKRIKITNFG